MKDEYSEDLIYMWTTEKKNYVIYKNKESENEVLVDISRNYPQIVKFYDIDYKKYVINKMIEANVITVDNWTLIDDITGKS